MRSGSRANYGPMRAWSSCSSPTARTRVAHNALRITPLHVAARTGALEKAQALLDAGADLTARDEHLRSTPLAWAAKFGQREMVTLLLERGAPRSLPDDPAWATPLAWAKKRGHEEIARLLQQ